MNYVNAIINVSLLLIITYMISYFIVYVATVYDVAVKGKGSVLDNPYLAKFLLGITTAIYYILYYLYVAIQGSINYTMRNAQTALLIFLVILSLTLCILYTKIY